MFKTSCTRPSIQLALSAARRSPRASSTLLSARAGISHLAPRHNSASALAEDASPPASQDSGTPPQPAQSSSPRAPNTTNSAPQPRSEVLLPFQTSTVNTVAGTDTTNTTNSKYDESLEDKSVLNVRSTSPGNASLSDVPIFDPRMRPMSEHELEMRYYESNNAKTSHSRLSPMPPAKHLFRGADEHQARQIKLMYRAMNDSLKMIQGTIQYDFKDPLILWAVLQDYATSTDSVKFFPRVDAPDNCNDLFKVGRTVFEQLYGSTWTRQQLAERAFAMNIHKHIYRYNVQPITSLTLPQFHECLARRVLGLLGAVWVDSGKQRSSVERFLSVTDLWKHYTPSKPQSEVLCALEAITMNTVKKSREKSAFDESLDDESEQKSDGVKMKPPRPVSFNPQLRPMSEYELEKKYYEGNTHVEPTHMYLTPPLHLHPEGDSRTKDVMAMYRAMNESLEAVQAAIEYDFKDTSLLWAALQGYHSHVPELFPSARRNRQRYLAIIGKTLVRLAIETETDNNNTALYKLDGIQHLSKKLIPNRGARKYIHNHVYRYSANKPMTIEELRRAVAAILGAVWLDSGKQWDSVERFLAAMDIK